MFNSTSIREIIVQATTPPTTGSRVHKINPYLKIKVPKASVALYKAASVWSTYASIIEGY